MGRRCQICSNTSINIINRALLGGATLSEIARRHGLALGSLHRHRSKCLGLPTSQAVTAAPSRLAGIEAALPTREEVAGGFASIRSQLDGIVADAKAKGQLSISVAALDGLRKTWADTARLAGHDRPADTNIQVNVNTGPNITIIIDKLLAVVDDAATKEKLATALLDLDGMSASARTAPPTIDAVARPAPPAIDAGAPPAPDSVTCDGGEPPASGDSVLDRIMREAAA